MMSMLFILVVLAALGVALTSLSQRQQLGSAGELASSKAYQGAYAGLEWGSFQVMTGASAPSCFATKNIALPDQLAGYTVTVACTRSTGTDGASSLTFYQVTATACNIPDAGGACPNAGTAEPAYAERQLTRSLSR
jgi:MSHA biogenesis protein MshP